jgi:hypothetical protein
LSPIVLHSVSFGTHDLSSSNDKYRSDLIAIPDGAYCTEVALKIVESNPYKVRAEKILALWNDNKENSKTIINNFLPKNEEEEQQEAKAEEKPSTVSQ